MPPRSSVPPRIQEAIAEYADEQRYGAAAVERELRASEALADLRDEIPSRRTIQRLLAHRRVAPGEAWLPSTATEDQATVMHLLEVATNLAHRTNGRVWKLSVEEVPYLNAIQKAAPDLDPWVRYRIAREFLRRNGEAEDLELLLTVAPWSDPERESIFFSALQEGGFLPDGDISKWGGTEEIERSIESTESDKDMMADIGSALFFHLWIKAMQAIEETEADDD